MRRYKKIETIQKDKCDCGISCILFILKFYNKERSLENLRFISGTSESGVTLLGLSQCAEEIGFIPKAISCTIDHIKETKEPIIIHLIENKILHYIVVVKYDHRKRRFIVNDPAKGVIYLDEKELINKWSGVCLLLTPTDSFFIKNNDIKSIKKDKVKFLIGILSRERSFLLLSFFVSVFSTLLGLATPIFTQKMVDDILPSHDKRIFFIAVSLFGLILLINIFLNFVRSTLLSLQNKDFNKRIFGFFISTVMLLPKLFFISRQSGDFIARLNDLSKIQRSLAIFAVSYSVDILTILFAISYIMIISYKVGIIVIGVIPFFLFAIFRYNKVILLKQKEEAVAYSHLESGFVSTFRNISNIKNDQLVDYLINQNTHHSNIHQNKKFSLRRIGIWLSVNSQVITTILFVLVICILSFDVFEDKISIGYLVSCLGVLGIFMSALNNLSLIYLPYYELKVAFNRMYDIIQEKEENYIEENTLYQIEDIEYISMENVYFNYPGQKSIYNNFSLKISKGDKIVVSGNNGCGKSTLIDILVGNISIHAGNIFMNGYNVENIDKHSISKLIGIVPQEISVYSNSILWNITLSTNIDLTPLLYFIGEKYLRFFLEMLPNLGTFIGDGGVMLSKGQIQIIGLLRVLYKIPKVLFLDEPTSALDPIAKDIVYDLLQEINNKGVTIIIISHDNIYIDNSNNNIKL